MFSNITHFTFFDIISFKCLFVSRAFYTRRKFRPIYAKVMNQSNRNYNALSLLAETLPHPLAFCLFDYPFNELLVSANN